MTTARRFPGWTPEAWEAEKKKTGLNDDQLYDVLRVTGAGQNRDQRAKRFFRSSKTGAPKL